MYCAAWTDHEEASPARYVRASWLSRLHTHYWVTADATREMVDFSAQRPQERFAGIQEALGVRDNIVDLADGPQLLRHGQSDYVQQFGMSVDTTPLQIASRMLPPPTMLYGGSSREVSNLFGLMRCANKRLSVGQVRRLEHVRKYRRFVATCSCTSQGEQAFH